MFHVRNGMLWCQPIGKVGFSMKLDWHVLTAYKRVIEDRYNYEARMWSRQEYPPILRQVEADFDLCGLAPVTLVCPIGMEFWSGSNFGGSGHWRPCLPCPQWQIHVHALTFAEQARIWKERLRPALIYPVFQLIIQYCCKAKQSKVKQSNYTSSGKGWM